MDVAHKTNLGSLTQVGFWKTTRFNLSLQNPLVMGIVNATPDSFSSQNCSDSPEYVFAKAETLLREGADILDVGGESTRPGAMPLTHDQEWQRLEPVLRELISWKIPVSVDTYHPENMQKSLDLGVDIINDIWALRQTNALDVVSKYDCGVCLMHMHGVPSTMQLTPMLEESIEPVVAFFQKQTHLVQSSGVHASRIVIDPGIGFGKTVKQNFDILQKQKLLLNLGFPVMVGWSRKSSLGQVTGLDVTQRLVPSIVAAVMAVERGARIVRVHDVAQTVAAMSIWKAAPEFV
jgi:dihydropteroate synthase